MSTNRDPKTQTGQSVSLDGHAAVDAVTQTELEHASGEHGLGYSWSSGTYDPAVGDTILLIKNTSDLELHIEMIWLSTDVDTRVVIHCPTTVVTPAGTAVTNVNLNRGKPNDADLADARRDETDNSQGGYYLVG